MIHDAVKFSICHTPKMQTIYRPIRHHDERDDVDDVVVYFKVVSRHYALQQQASLCPYAADEELLYLLTLPSSVRSDVHYSLTPFRHQRPRPSESPPIGCKA